MANGNQGEAGISTGAGPSETLLGEVGESITPLSQRQLEASAAQVAQDRRAFESLDAAMRQGIATSFLQDSQLLAEGRGGVALGGARVRQSRASIREAIASKMLAQQSLDAAEAKALESEAKLAGQEAQFAKDIEEFPRKQVDEFLTQVSELGNDRAKLAPVVQSRLRGLDLSLPHEREAALLLLQAYQTNTRGGGRAANLSEFNALLSAGVSPTFIVDYMERNRSRLPPMSEVAKVQAQDRVVSQGMPSNQQVAEEAASLVGLGYTEEQIQEILDQTSV